MAQWLKAVTSSRSLSEKKKMKNPPIFTLPTKKQQNFFDELRQLKSHAISREHLEHLPDL